jgi:hypothetical protein
MNKMENRDLHAAWVAALRSGEYMQTIGKLRSSDGAYCCLGVLAKIAGLEINKAGNGIEGESDYERISLLVAQRASHFIHLNDAERKSFAEIADFIEAEL